MKISLRVTLLLYTLLIVVAVGGGISYCGNRISYERSLQMTELKHRSTTELVASGLVDDIYFLKIQSLQKRLSETMAVNPDLLSAVITNHDGIVLANTCEENDLRDEPLSGLFAERVMHTDEMIVSKKQETMTIGIAIVDPAGDRLGNFIAEYSLNEDNMSRRAMMHSNVLLTAMFLLGGTLAAILFSWKVSKPVLDLVEAAKNIASNKFDTRVQINSNKELELLGRTINEMAASLEQTTVSKEYVDSILDSMCDGLLVVSDDGMIEAVNPAICQLAKSTAADLIGQPVWGIIVDEHGLPFSRSKTVRDTFERIGSPEGMLVPASDDPMPVMLSWAAKEAGSGVSVLTVKDITEQKMVAKKLVQLNERYEKSALQATAASVVKSEFLANMSHEIRTPMTAILGFTDILLGNVVNPENLEAAHTIKRNGEYLINLINDILDLSKIESGKIELELSDYSPHRLIGDTLSLMRVRATAKGLPLEAHFDGPIPETINTDPTRLRQILINIVGNAIKFTETGSVQILTRLLNKEGEEPRLQFDVIDSGIGIASDKIDKIFQPFAQADGTTTRKFGGTGLGLSISKRLVQLLGGEFSVSSTVGKGSTFSVTVSTGPLDDVQLIHDAVDLGAEKIVDEISNDTKVPLSNCRILLAEDGPDNQRLISFILKKAGAEVTLAENGQLGLDLATVAKSEGRPFDVILMDMQMPILDGYSATRQLREDDYTLPIIALTAHAMSSDRQKCLDAGCDDYATKPVDRKKLVELVASYAKRANEVALSEE
ncbi:MAG: hypothetical protein COA78_14655 [Blastopirellula sp.]|nr:MAG: hypothetical protein COA78_14655 [Blastopirellula sp.]